MRGMRGAARAAVVEKPMKMIRVGSMAGSSRNRSEKRGRGRRREGETEADGRD
jgi:hypothetical protein